MSGKNDSGKKGSSHGGKMQQSSVDGEPKEEAQPRRSRRLSTVMTDLATGGATVTGGEAVTGRVVAEDLEQPPLRRSRRLSSALELTLEKKETAQKASVKDESKAQTHNKEDPKTHKHPSTSKPMNSGSGSSLGPADKDRVAQLAGNDTSTPPRMRLSLRVDNGRDRLPNECKFENLLLPPVMVTRPARKVSNSRHTKVVVPPPVGESSDTRNPSLPHNTADKSAKAPRPAQNATGQGTSSNQMVAGRVGSNNVVNKSNATTGSNVTESTPNTPKQTVAVKAVQPRSNNLATTTNATKQSSTQSVATVYAPRPENQGEGSTSSSQTVAGKTVVPSRSNNVANNLNATKCSNVTDSTPNTPKQTVAGKTVVPPRSRNDANKSNATNTSSTQDVTPRPDNHVTGQGSTQRKQTNMVKTNVAPTPPPLLTISRQQNHVTPINTDTTTHRYANGTQAFRPTAANTENSDEKPVVAPLHANHEQDKRPRNLNPSLYKVGRRIIPPARPRDSRWKDSTENIVKQTEIVPQETLPVVPTQLLPVRPATNSSDINDQNAITGPLTRSRKRISTVLEMPPVAAVTPQNAGNTIAVGEGATDIQQGRQIDSGVDRAGPNAPKRVKIEVIFTSDGEAPDADVQQIPHCNGTRCPMTDHVVKKINKELGTEAVGAMIVNPQTQRPQSRVVVVDHARQKAIIKAGAAAPGGDNNKDTTESGETEVDYSTDRPPTPNKVKKEVDLSTNVQKAGAAAPGGVVNSVRTESVAHTTATTQQPIRNPVKKELVSPTRVNKEVGQTQRGSTIRETLTRRETEKDNKTGTPSKLPTIKTEPVSPVRIKEEMTNRSNGLNKVEARPPTKENDSLRTTTRSTCQSLDGNSEQVQGPHRRVSSGVKVEPLEVLDSCPVVINTESQVTNDNNPRQNHRSSIQIKREIDVNGYSNNPQSNVNVQKKNVSKGAEVTSINKKASAKCSDHTRANDTNKRTVQIKVEDSEEEEVPYYAKKLTNIKEEPESEEEN